MGHYRRKKKRRGLKYGEKKVLKYGLPLALVVGILVQLAVKFLPTFYDATIGYIWREAERSRFIIMSKVKEQAIKDMKNKELYEQEAKSTWGSSDKGAEAVKEKYRRRQREEWDATYEEIEKEILNDEIEQYEELFEEEKNR